MNPRKLIFKFFLFQFLHFSHILFVRSQQPIVLVGNNAEDYDGQGLRHNHDNCMADEQDFGKGSHLY